MPDRFSRRILMHIADQRYRPSSAAELAGELGIKPDEMDTFRKAVDQLVDEGQVVLGERDEVSLPPPGPFMSGSFRLNPRGFGFIVPDNLTAHGDLFVPPGATAGAMTGDRVKAKVMREPRRAGSGRSPYTGKIVEILQRSDQHYVGNLFKRGSHWLVQVDGNTLHDPVLIRDPHAKNAHDGDKVVIELVVYPDDDTQAEGVITEVLGEQGEPDVETAAVMRAFGLVEEFPPQVIDDAREASKRYEPEKIPADREDMTDLFIMTIDPPDAKDFDDAISIRKIEGEGKGQGRRAKGQREDADPESLGPRPSAHGPSDSPIYELGVHIADVAHFVTPGTALDDEAKSRGNSVYLPRKVIPMLPELLSNGVCSLQEGVNRYVKSAFIRYDAKGKVLGTRFARGVIRSAKRLTYREAQALIDDDLREAVKHARTEPKYPRPVIEHLKLMNELATIIRKRRLKDGMIVLALPEVELVFDDTGRVVDAVPEDDAFTHKIIEMFMVEANEAVARLFNNLDVPMIRRTHPDPPQHDISDLRQFARVAGFNIPAQPSRYELQQLLDKVRGKPAQHAVHLAVLQTLSKAEYSPMLIGHFALASEHYLHFTSPIRRYPDLIAHRALDAYFEKYADHKKHDLPRGKRLDRLGSDLRGDRRCPDEKELFAIGKHCSATERNAESAERELREFLVLQLLEEEHLGDDFAGIVTGITGQGLYIQLDRFLVDGFIRHTDLTIGGPGERWRLNRQTGALVAQRSGKTITIGDRFTVRIAKVSPAGRQLDLVIIDAQGGRSKKAGKVGGKKKSTGRRQPKGARAAHQKTAKIKQQRNRKGKGKGKGKGKRGR